MQAAHPFLQHGFNLSESVVYDSRALRRFVDIDLGGEPVSDEIPLCQFRPMLEQHNLGDSLFHRMDQYLQENGMKASRGTIVDASIIHAPSSTRHKKKKRAPEIYQSCKGRPVILRDEGSYLGAVRSLNQSMTYAPVILAIPPTGGRR